MNKTTSNPLAGLRNGKRELRDVRRKMTLPEKVAQVVELQRVMLPAIRRRRPLKAWERVWDVRDSDRSSRNE